MDFINIPNQNYSRTSRANMDMSLGSHEMMNSSINNMNKQNNSISTTPRYDAQPPQSYIPEQKTMTMLNSVPRVQPKPQDYQTPGVKSQIPQTNSNNNMSISERLNTICGSNANEHQLNQNGIQSFYEPQSTPRQMSTHQNMASQYIQMQPNSARKLIRPEMDQRNTFCGPNRDSFHNPPQHSQNSTLMQSLNLLKMAGTMSQRQKPLPQNYSSMIDPQVQSPLQDHQKAQMSYQRQPPMNMRPPRQQMPPQNTHHQYMQQNPMSPMIPQNPSMTQNQHQMMYQRSQYQARQQQPQNQVRGHSQMPQQMSMNSAFMQRNQNMGSFQDQNSVLQVEQRVNVEIQNPADNTGNIHRINYRKTRSN